ncbi:MAG: substrate-binding domain-containing protein [Opitutaceae bacterium]
MARPSKPPAQTAAVNGGVAELERTVKQLVISKTCDINKPLPTTRELGERHHVSNASACRLLKRLDEEGVIWRRENGRYYPNESRRLFERRKPYACLIRKLQHWSRMYHAIMSGVSQPFGRNKTSMLFVHNESLVHHADTEHPPVHAGLSAQRKALAEFFHHHESEFGGLLLDDVWLDDALAKFSDGLGNAVVVCRTTTLPELSSVSVDFDASALMAVGHLYARGYEEIWIAVPFSNSAPVDLMQAAALKAAAGLGSAIDPKHVCSAATPADRTRLIARLNAAKKRVGVFCLEDNISLVLWRTFNESGIDCPRQIGLLSGMGDIVSELGISSIKIDYEAIGRAAGEILVTRKHRIVKHASRLVLGRTT